jgi:hypothetical protein
MRCERGARVCGAGKGAEMMMLLLTWHKGSGERLGGKCLRMSRDAQRSEQRFERALILLPRREKKMEMVVLIGSALDNRHNGG